MKGCNGSGCSTLKMRFAVGVVLNGLLLLAKNPKPWPPLLCVLPVLRASKGAAPVAAAALPNSGMASLMVCCDGAPVLVNGLPGCCVMSLWVLLGLMVWCVLGWAAEALGQLNGLVGCLSAAFWAALLLVLLV